MVLYEFHLNKNCRKKILKTGEIWMKSRVQPIVVHQGDTGEGEWEIYVFYLLLSSKCKIIPKWNISFKKNGQTTWKDSLPKKIDGK